MSGLKCHAINDGKYSYCTSRTQEPEPSPYQLSVLFQFIFKGSVVALLSKHRTIKDVTTFLLLYSIQFCVGSAKL